MTVLSWHHQMIAVLNSGCWVEECTSNLLSLLLSSLEMQTLFSDIFNNSQVFDLSFVNWRGQQWYLLSRPISYLQIYTHVKSNQFKFVLCSFTVQFLYCYGEVVSSIEWTVVVLWLFSMSTRVILWSLKV